MQRAHGDYIVTMAFPRQLNDRRMIELAAFSMPAVAACLALLLIPHGLKANKTVPLVVSLPNKSAVSAVQTQEATVTAPTVSPIAAPNETPMEKRTSEPLVPQARLMPFDGLGPTAPLQKPDVVPSQSHAIIVQAGHTLWRIARETYGNGRDYPVIVDANRGAISKPELIHPGQQLVLPDKKAN